jgi:hypothetical protein
LEIGPQAEVTVVDQNRFITRDVLESLQSEFWGYMIQDQNQTQKEANDKAEA